MIQEILIPIVLRIQRAIRYWIYRRKYLPYLRLKRRRDKIKMIALFSYHNCKKTYQGLFNGESQALNKHIGFNLNLVYLPNYFKEVSD